ncbi:hypothetical protein [Verrucomicrobium sp. BvORR106]|uniref:hypothetical protein n=1 Tax=Verrucomicrobium sp. BvORR106 TaxID=1403819 RepID=UPI002240EE44|nr:hypothetical protein [Verrucomicrobium sp. BvORR106]
MLPLTPVASDPTTVGGASSNEGAPPPQAPAVAVLQVAQPLPSELATLQARCEYLSQELNRRGLAIQQQAVLLTENKTQFAALQKRLAKQESEIKRLHKVVLSAKEWQQRGWMKRAFHKWRAPGGDKS